MRARTAAMKPKAAAMQLSAAGTISCRAPQARPPSGKWESIAAKPKGGGLRGSPIRGMSRRSSAITASRLRATAATGAGFGCAKPMDIHLDIRCMFLLVCIEQNRNYAKAGIGPMVIVFSNQWLAQLGEKTVASSPCSRTEERMTRCRCLSFAAR
jgi:hypothetical protein